MTNPNPSPIGIGFGFVLFGTGGKIGFKQKPSIYAGFAVQKSVHILEKQQNPYQNRRLDL